MPLNTSSLTIHADAQLAAGCDVTPPIGVSTTFKYADNPADLVPEHEVEDVESKDYYSRSGNEVTRRVEKVLETILSGECVVYRTGLAAFHSAMVYYNPKRVFVGQCYHGCMQVLELLQRNYGVEIHDLESIQGTIQSGDVVHLETPVNPLGTAMDIEKYAKLAHDADAYLVVDATFAPPPACDPFKFGADMIMHSATKYLGGHNDLLAGVLVTKSAEARKTLWEDRGVLGNVPGSMESWLLLRSLRTFDMRFKTQMKTAARVLAFLTETEASLTKLDKIYHSNVQNEEFINKQLPLGGCPVFAIETVDVESAQSLPSRLALFTHATSLGGVTSLVEWRQMSDDRVSPRLLRFSLGCEDADDLIADLKQALA